MDFAAGLTLRTTRGTVHLRGVLLDADGSSDAIVRQFEHRATEGEDLWGQLHSLGQDLVAELRAQSVVAGAIREGGFARGASANQPATKNRLRAEGVALTHLRGVTSAVVLNDINGLSHLVGLTAHDLQARADVVASSPWSDALTAAIAARALRA